MNDSFALIWYQAVLGKKYNSEKEISKTNNPSSFKDINKPECQMWYIFTRIFPHSFRMSFLIEMDE